MTAEGGELEHAGLDTLSPTNGKSSGPLSPEALTWMTNLMEEMVSQPIMHISELHGYIKELEFALMTRQGQFTGKSYLHALFQDPNAPKWCMMRGADAKDIPALGNQDALERGYQEFLVDSTKETHRFLSEAFSQVWMVVNYRTMQVCREKCTWLHVTVSRTESTPTVSANDREWRNDGMSGMTLHTPSVKISGFTPFAFVKTPDSEKHRVSFNMTLNPEKNLDVESAIDMFNEQQMMCNHRHDAKALFTTANRHQRQQCRCQLWRQD